MFQTEQSTCTTKDNYMITEMFMWLWLYRTRKDFHCTRLGTFNSRCYLLCWEQRPKHKTPTITAWIWDSPSLSCTWQPIHYLIWFTINRKVSFTSYLTMLNWETNFPWNFGLELKNDTCCRNGHHIIFIRDPWLITFHKWCHKKGRWSQ